MYAKEWLASTLFLFGCTSPHAPLGAQTAPLGCQNQPCQTSADCICDGYSCTRDGICVAAQQCAQMSCRRDSNCCPGDYCAAGGSCVTAVNLVLRVDHPAVPPGDADVVVTFTVSNLGSSTTGKVALTFATPSYVNVSRAAALPAGCTLLYENQDITVPEIVRCEIAGVNHGQELTFPVHLTVSDKAPPTIPNGIAIVLPVPGSPDKELALLDNLQATGVSVERNDVPASGNVNLFASYVAPALGGPLLALQRFLVGNNGREATHGEATLTVTTAFFTNIDRTRALPSGCRLLFENKLPDVPEIVRCTLARGLAPGSTRVFDLPIVPVAGAPVGTQLSTAAVAVGAESSDVDSDRTDNILTAPLLMLSPQPFFSTVNGTATAPALKSAASAARVATRVATRPRVRVNASPGGLIDLNLGFVVAAARAGEAAVQTLIVGNRGADTTGAIRLVYALPAFVNIDRHGATPLPGVCQFLYENVDFSVPEIVACTLPGLRHGDTVKLAIPLKVTANAPASGKLGQAIVMPAPGSADSERFIGDNLVRPLLKVLFNPDSRPPPVSGNLVDLYGTGEFPDILIGAPAEVHFRIANKGPNATRGETSLTFATPLFVNIDRNRGLPNSCHFLYQNQDPTVPEIVECRLPAGLLARSEATLAIPVVLLPGGLPGQQASTMIVHPASSRDVELDLVDNLSPYGVMVSTAP